MEIIYKDKKKVFLDEVEVLEKKRDQLKIDIENMRNLVNEETEKKVMSARKLSADTEEARKQFLKDKEELEKFAIDIKKQKEQLVAERETLEVAKEDAKKAFDRVAGFIVMVRREADKL